MATLPLTGEKVKCEYYQIDELEAKCWLKDYQVWGVVENKYMNPSYVGKEDILIVADVNHDTHDVKLIRL